MVMALMSSGFMVGSSTLFRDALDEARLDRQLGGRQRQRLARQQQRNAVDLEQDAARLDARDPELGRALARSHADLQRLLRYRHVRIDPDPHPAGALHVAGERPARGFDLAGGDPLRLHRLEAVLAKGERGARSRKAVDTTFVRLAELRARRLQHDYSPFSISVRRWRSGRVAARTPDI